jgi:AcrR family transcriptional regulator
LDRPNTPAVFVPFRTATGASFGSGQVRSAFGNEGDMAKQKPVDRRVQRTRGLLQDALLSMMIEKGYEATTVQDIIDRANVGRATFYAHFADKKTLLSSGIEDLRASLTKQLAQSQKAAGDSSARGLSFALPMLEHARNHLELYGAIIGKESGSFVMQRIHFMVVDLVRDDLVALGFKRDTEHRELLVQHITGGFMAVMTRWVEGGAKLTPQDVDALFRRLAMRGLAAESR